MAEGATVATEPGVGRGSRIDLYWMPLGAGGRVVRWNGRRYEGWCARRDGRRPLELYHAALEVRVPGGRYSIELTPVPDRQGAARGVTREGPVGSRRLGRFRPFRYELRCWRDGCLPDLQYAVDSPRGLTDDPLLATAVLSATASVPALVWGRDELRVGEMWNSNSVIAWLLASTHVPLCSAEPPRGGRAPGWSAGLAAARRSSIAAPPPG